jgi:surfactin synthase thioesterase subunit
MSGTQPGRWLLRPPSEQAGARLFCIPYSGCGASMYRSWPQFAGDLEICPVQLPGREGRMRDEPADSYQELAATLIEALLPVLDRPFAFFGHCAAALPGYEAARQLAARGYPVPARVFVSSQVAPHQGPHGRFLEMTSEQLRDEISGLIVRAGGKPLPSLVDLSLEVLLADIELNRQYRLPEPVRLACPITAIGWRQDAEVDPALMTGWTDCGDTTFRSLDGEHYSFMAGSPDLLDVFLLDLRRPVARR